MAEAGHPRFARILVSNDDGIDAPGLKLLERIAHALSPEVWVVAPEMEQSGAGHSLTTRRPIRLMEVAPQRYFVDGTPTDCVLLGLKRLLRDRRPSLVLAGINAGGNIAEDITYSGTCAAAMEATLFGVPSIALSQEYRDRNAVPWGVAEAFAEDAIRRIVAAAADPWPKDTFFNVNFPAAAPSQVRGFAMTHQGKRVLGDNLSEGTDPRGRHYYWIGPSQMRGGADPGTDLGALADLRVSITPIHLNLTNVAVAAALRPAFE
ncbi:MAG TPA: 5'/3'-nucleotidase SurE [Stellaceae bacterium]|jgi:5'-nucleotidase|nr:5'/3'-nucleotidase SurE [Stellaceae bacterium]